MKKSKPIQLSSQSEIVSQLRRPHSIDGTIKAGTKVEDAKGKKKYKRAEFKDKRSW